MRYLISNRPYQKHEYYSLDATFDHFVQWVENQSSYELDIETNVTDDITLREIHVVQFGSIDQQWQFVIDVNGLTPKQLEKLKEILGDDSKQKIGFNLMFEISVIEVVWGVHVDNVFDVMILLKLVLNGKYMEDEVFNLAGAVKTYLGIDMSKAEQTTFTSAMMTPEQVKYAADDVMYNVPLANVVYSWVFEEPVWEWDENLNNYVKTGTKMTNIAQSMQESINLRMRALPGISQILVNAFKFNKEKWDENIRWAQEEADKEYIIMCDYIRENLYDECVHRGLIAGEDKLTVNWASHNKNKKEILKRLYPELAKTTKEALKKFSDTLPDDNYIDYILDKQYDALNHRLLTEQRDKLKGLDCFQEKGQILINFNSTQQRLELFKIEHPGISNTAADTLEKLSGPLIGAYQKWVKKTKLVSSYGANWYDYINSDGNIRATYIDPVLVTGRVAIKKPALQTVPADEGYYLGDRYREAFEALTDELISAVDFGSQELNIIADIAEEPAWIKANKENLDIHSISAGLIFGQKWVDAGGDPNGDKAKVKEYGMEAKAMRSKAKTMSFGLAFGLGASGAAKRMDITIREAQELIDSFYSGLTKLGDYFDKAAKFGQSNGWIATMPPFNFRRNFPNWNYYHVDSSDDAAIGRESKNFRIQAMAAEQSLQAIYLIYKYIKDNDLWDKVKIVFFLHDCTVCRVKKDFAEEWGQKHIELMEEAAKINMKHVKIPGDLTLTETWVK